MLVSWSVFLHSFLFLMIQSYTIVGYHWYIAGVDELDFSRVFDTSTYAWRSTDDFAIVGCAKDGSFSMLQNRRKNPNPHRFR